MESLTVIAHRLFGLEYPSGKKVMRESRWMSVGLLAFTLKSISHLACDLINKKFEVLQGHQESKSKESSSSGAVNGVTSSVR
ncbi:hypothetical protein SK128_013380, partial [Halocaridina rubra]